MVVSGLRPWLWLSTKAGLSSNSVAALLRRFHTPEGILGASEAQLDCVHPLSENAKAALLDHSMAPVDRILDECARRNINILTLQDSAYPYRLKNIFAPPPVLYILGRLPEVDELAAIGVVGTRRCTGQGIETCERISWETAKGGGLIVSGMALGIDSASHRGALRAGKKTVAVLGCGLDICYPRSNRKLMQDIISSGAVVSEYPPGSEPVGWHFPERNRIISGLSSGVLIAEAPEKSGAMITAKLALEQDRDVFAVDGGDNPAYAGNAALIRDGAKPVESGADILEEYVHLYPVDLNAAASKQPTAGTVNLTPDQQRIMNTLSDGEMQVDALIQKTGLAASQVLAALTMLEIKGMVKQLPGKRFVRKPGW